MNTEPPEYLVPSLENFYRNQIVKKSFNIFITFLLVLIFFNYYISTFLKFIKISK